MFSHIVQLLHVLLGHDPMPVGLCVAASKRRSTPARLHATGLL